jgi:hypothetical protein
VESYLTPKGPLQCKRCQRFGHTQRNCGYAPRCVACGDFHISGGCPAPRGQPLCCSCWVNHTANYRGCVKWKEAKAAIAKRAPVLGSKETNTSNPAAPNATHTGPSAEQMDLGEGWSHVVRGGRVVRATSPTSIPNPQPVTEAPEQPKVTATRKTAKPKKPTPRPAAAVNATSAKPTKKASASYKTVAAKCQINNLVLTPQLPASVLEDISDLLDNLPLQACVELTRRMLTSIPYLPPGAARPGFS